MPEINPYESPQSEQLPRAEEQFAEEHYPPWLGQSLWTQFGAIIVTWTCASITVAPAKRPAMEWFVLCLVIFSGIFSLINFIAAIRYRIGWLVLLELIVIGLPLVTIFTIIRFNLG
jgi:hypothetical protein